MKSRWVVLAAMCWSGCGGGQPAASPRAPEPEPAPAATAEAPKRQYSPGLEVVDVKVGSGPECKPGDRITVRYVGTLDDGSEFDSSPSVTFTIGVGMLIKGWDEGIPGMRVGGVRKLTIPASLGYGSAAKPKIPAYSTLHFEVELLAINP